MILRRKWPCACCGEAVYYDAKSGEISCSCGVVINKNLSKSQILLNFYPPQITPVERNR